MTIDPFTSTTSPWDSVPVLDLALLDDGGSSSETSGRAQLVALLDAALRRFGFFYVQNHGIPQALIEEQFQIADQIFDLPLAEKQAMPFDNVLDIGWIGSGAQTLDTADDTAQMTGDTKEQFMMTTNKLIHTRGNENSGDGDDENKPKEDNLTTIDPDNVFDGSQNYQPNVPRHGQVTTAYASAAYKLNLQLNSLLFDALDANGDDQDKNEAKTEIPEMTRDLLGQNPFIVLKQMKYSLHDPSDPARGKYGAGAHTDWGSFTILCTDGKPGLQIHMPEEQRWLPVPHKEGCLIINSGDQIGMLTNDVYRSALHRVVIEPEVESTQRSDERTSARFSTAIFTYFGMQAQMGPLPQFQKTTTKYPPPHRTSQEYFHFKLQESTSGGKAY